MDFGPTSKTAVKVTNRQVHLVSRPRGIPNLDNFKLCEAPVPELGEGEVLVRALYLSVDPYMRGRIGGRPSMHAPFPLYQSMNGDGVGEVVESKHPKFQIGDTVYGHLEWANYSTARGDDLRRFDPTAVYPTTALSVLGMPAMTAYFGLLDIGKPQSGETVVISGAAGAVGTIVGQIAKIKGCRVIGIAGSDEKANFLVNELGFDMAVNYKSPDWTKVLEGGLDLYFDNVGGNITDEVLKRINWHARIILSGQISSYNLEQPDIGPRNFRHLIVKSATARGFLVTHDYINRYAEARIQLYQWLKRGKIKPCETVIEGLENIPSAFLGLFSGSNLGKQIVKVC